MDNTEEVHEEMHRLSFTSTKPTERLIFDSETGELIVRDSTSVIKDNDVPASFIYKDGFF